MSAEKSVAGAASGSLADRITRPTPGSTAVVPPSQSAPTASSWADETAPPVVPNPAPTDTAIDSQPSDLVAAQGDGAGAPQGGSNLQEPDYEVEVKLSDLQADPNNPLYSIKKFEDLGLPEDVLKGVFLMRFSKPSKIQEKALPLLLSNPPQNMIGQSQSGTGKTAAFVLTMLSRLDRSKPNTPQAICLAPSRELARQIMGVIQSMGCFIDGLRTQFAIPQAVARGEKIEAQIIVGTPGTTLDMIKKRQLDVSQVRVFVLDEADNMIDQQGLGEQCLRVRSLMPKTCQIVLFSATFPHEVVRYAGKFAPNANIITLKHEELTVEGIKQFWVDCPSEENKYETLVKLYGTMTIGSSIIFVRKRSTADEIKKRMEAQGHTIAALHGAFEGADRDKIIDEFREGKAKVLITTNVLARGLDVQSISMVVNYDVPEDQKGKGDSETYLHRIGRTGRFGRVGVAITFVYDKSSWTQLRDITDYFGIKIDKLPTEDWDEVEAILKKELKRSRAGTNFKMQ